MSNGRIRQFPSINKTNNDKDHISLLPTINLDSLIDQFFFKMDLYLFQRCGFLQSVTIFIKRCAYINYITIN